MIEELRAYKRIVARIEILGRYSVGNGITVSRINQDDQLQDLHRQLRGKPSYMYLNGHEQALESTAHAYLTKYPAGAKSQLEAIPRRGADADDEKRLREIRGKIQKVIDARGWSRDDLESVLERVAELEDLQTKRKNIEMVLDAVESYKPEYARLLRLRYVENFTAEAVAANLSISVRTFRRWQLAAIEEVKKVIGE